MVKHFVKIIVALFITSALFAGTAGGANDGRLFGTAYFDVHTKTQAPILDYIKYSKRGSFDVKQYLDTVNKINEKYINVYIHGRIVVPESVATDKVYVNVGPKYYYKHGGYYLKEISYNGSKTVQNAEYFLAATKTDSFGKRYVDYKIHFLLEEPWKIKVSGNVSANSFFFKIAPKTRGFKNKFETADIYVLDE